MNVVISPHAQELLDEQLGIIANARCPEDAAKWLSGLLDRLDLLETFPESCPLSRFPDLANVGIRTLVYGKFIAYYVIVGEDCIVISIRRAAMDIQSPKEL